MDDKLRDWELLRKYLDSHSQPAFAQLTKRYLGLVYGTALRELRDRTLAEDTTQAVFLILARKAHTFRSNVILPAWLFDTCKFTALHVQRDERRRQMREQKIAMEIHRNGKADQEHVTEIMDLGLNDALSALPRVDREAVLLHYVCGYTFEETGEAFGVSEEAARKRTGRAIDKLRRSLTKAGIGLSVIAIADQFKAQAAQASQSVPPELESRLSDLISSHAAAPLAGVSAHAIAQGALKSMNIMNLKLAATVTCGLALAGGTVYHGVAQAAQRQRQAIRTVSFTPVQSERPANPAGLGTEDPTASKARAALQRMYDAYGALKSFSCDMESEQSKPVGLKDGLTEQRSSRRSATYLYESPDRIAFTTENQAGKSVAVSDGTTLFVTTTEQFVVGVAPPNRYLSLPLDQIELEAPGDTNRSYARSVLARYGGLSEIGWNDSPWAPNILLGVISMPADGPYGFVLGKPSVLNGEPVDTIVLKMRNSISTGPATSTPTAPRLFTLSIGSRDHILRRVTVESVVTGGLWTISETYNNIRVNPILPPTAFTFTPAPGSTAVANAADLHSEVPARQLK